MQDFMPYQYTKESFVKEMNKLQGSNFIVIGETKAVNIDFSVLYPQRALYINVNMLVEFTHFGQLIPTRFDVAFF